MRIIFLLIHVLFAVQVNGGDIETLSEIADASQAVQQQLVNLRVSAKASRGTVGAFFMQDDLELYALDNKCLCHLKDRDMSTVKQKYFKVRVASFTQDYAFILIADNPGEEFRVDGIELDPAKVEQMAERLAWGDWIMRSTWTVNGIPLSQILKDHKSINISTKTANERKYWVVELEPDAKELLNNINQMEIQIDQESGAIASWKYVGTTTVEGKDYYNFSSQVNDLIEWPNGIVFPRHIQENSYQINEPVLDAKPAGDPVPSDATIQEVMIGDVTEEVFQPSHWGVPNSLVFIYPDRPRWPWILLVIIGVNAVALIVYFVLRRRRSY